jgi:hypothetical protein
MGYMDFKGGKIPQPIYSGKPESDQLKMLQFSSDHGMTLECTMDYINKPLLYHLAYTSYDGEGYEYYYNLFDLARDPSIIDKLLNL